MAQSGHMAESDRMVPDRFTLLEDLPGIYAGRFSVEMDLRQELAAVDQYAEVNLVPFMSAAEHVLAMEPLLKHDDISMLMHACFIGRPDVVKILLIEGQSLEHHDSEGMTALMIAAEQGNWACVRVLMQAGAIISAVSNDGRTALHYGASGTPNGFKAKVIDELLNAGADINAVSDMGNTALHESCQDHLHTVSMLLIRRNADINAVDHFDCTPLHLATGVNEEEGAAITSEGDAAITAILVACGADVTQRDFWDRTPLYHAEGPRHTLALYTLLEFAPQLQEPFYDDLSDAVSEQRSPRD